VFVDAGNRIIGTGVDPADVLPDMGLLLGDRVAADLAGRPGPA
jgi:hypothetical protein